VGASAPPLPQSSQDGRSEPAPVECHQRAVFCSQKALRDTSWCEHSFEHNLASPIPMPFGLSPGEVRDTWLLAHHDVPRQVARDRAQRVYEAIGARSLGRLRLRFSPVNYSTFSAAISMVAGCCSGPRCCGLLIFSFGCFRKPCPPLTQGFLREQGFELKAEKTERLPRLNPDALDWAHRHRLCVDQAVYDSVLVSPIPRCGTEAQ
jgi:hypothetical protein